MKLYAREQMIKAFDYGQNPKGFDWIGDMIDSLHAIELPSDEEIGKEMDKLPFTKYADDGLFNDGRIEGFQLGAEWVREYIVKQVQKELLINIQYK